MTIEDRHVAAASIGQVHRGVAADGRTVAVKLQYPGADRALRSDLRQIARLARVATTWMPAIDIKPVTDELLAAADEELDYGLEAGRLLAGVVAEHLSSTDPLGAGALTKVWPQVLREEFGPSFALARRLAALLTYPRFLPAVGPIGMAACYSCGGTALAVRETRRSHRTRT